MEYNTNQNINENNYHAEESPVLKEKDNSHKSLWYWIIAILLLGLLGWYGYTSGWFNRGARETQDSVEYTSDLQEGERQGEFSRNGTHAPIDNLLIKTSDSFPVQKTLSIKGNLPDGCTYLNDPQIIRDGNVFYVNLTTRKEGDMCTEALVPYERNIGLDVVGLPAGVYTVVINGKQTTFELEQDNSLDFETGSEK